MSTLIVGCGYLGLRVASLLTRRGERVDGTVRSSARADALRREGVEPVVVDVLDASSLGALPTSDRSLYCVGFDRTSGVPMRRVYVDGLRDALVRMAGKVGRVVYASSTGVYGRCDGDWIDENTPANPTHDSGRVVLEAEGVLADVSAP